jgi:hypothetical protein
LDARNAPDPDQINHPGKPSRQAEFYREEAARLRLVAATSGFGDLRQDFLKMADQYEILARQAEVNVLLSCAGWHSPGDTPNDGVASLPRHR